MILIYCNKIGINKLNLQIKDSLNLGIGEIKSFINEFKYDIDAVKNVISSDYSNGLAERSINKTINLLWNL